MKRLDSIFIVEKRVIYKDISSSVWYAIGFFRSEKRASSYLSACVHFAANDNFVSVSYRIRNVVLDAFELRKEFLYSKRLRSLLKTSDFLLE